MQSGADDALPLHRWQMSKACSPLHLQFPSPFCRNMSGDVALCNLEALDMYIIDFHSEAL